MAEARYVYCVLPGDAELQLDDVAGVDPARPLETVRAAGLTAVTGWVPLSEFGAEPLKRNLNDLDWLARTARAHEAVLERALASGAIVPLRMCTVFAGDAEVRAMLEHEHDALAGALARLRGHQEWGVKLMADVRRLREAAQAEGEPASGRAYLERKGRERREEEEIRQLAAQAAEEVHARLTERAAAATLLRPQARELSSRAGEMVLNGAYLVHAARLEEFRSAAAALAERQRPRGLELEVTGPWPPYNFAAP